MVIVFYFPETTKDIPEGIDFQTIYVYLNKLNEMLAINWSGVPQLFM